MERIGDISAQDGEKGLLPLDGTTHLPEKGLRLIQIPTDAKAQGVVQCGGRSPEFVESWIFAETERVFGVGRQILEQYRVDKPVP